MDLEKNGKQYCQKCKKIKSELNFYTYKTGGKCDLCKGCLTMHVNNWEPDTYLWILEKFDVPYIEEEWVKIRDKAYQKEGGKINGMSVVGKYLSKMRLRRFKDLTWADTEKLKAQTEKLDKELGKPKRDQIKEAYENGEISEAQWQTYQNYDMPEPHSLQPPAEVAQSNDVVFPFEQNYEEVDLPDVTESLTKEDKVYLALKWGKFYTVEQWVTLEKLYEDFMNSFDIQGAARIDTLKMICKTSLNMNQAIDTGDIESYQRLSRVYDMMMKSAKFTEAQNKADEKDFMNSIGQLVAYCEKEGGQIPQYKIDAPKDVIDTVVKDLKEYNKSLIHEDKTLAQEIEQYLKNKEAAEQMRRDREAAREEGLEAVELTDKDFLDFNQSLSEQAEKDEEISSAEAADELEDSYYPQDNYQPEDDYYPEEE